MYWCSKLSIAYSQQSWPSPLIPTHITSTSRCCSPSLVFLVSCHGALSDGRVPEIALQKVPSCYLEFNLLQQTLSLTRTGFEYEKILFTSMLGICIIVLIFVIVVPLIFERKTRDSKDETAPLSHQHHCMAGAVYLNKPGNLCSLKHIKSRCHQRTVVIAKPQYQK